MTDFRFSKYGFRWGPCHVERICSDDKFGCVLVVSGKHEEVQIRITPGGYLRIEDKTKPHTRPFDEPLGPNFGDV